MNERGVGKPKRRAWFGPGIVSGASDNDPTTVATLAVIGSTTVYGLLWLVLLVIPMLAVVQAIASRVGAVSRKGLEDCVRTHYGRVWSYPALAAILVVNVVTLAADLAGGAAALQMLTGIDYHWWLIPFAVVVVLLLVFARYEQVENVLKYVTLLFLLYIGAALLARPDWAAVLQGSFVPRIAWSKETVAGVIALLGTTLTSYAYVWETIEVSEERPPLRRLGLVQVDAAAGIIVAGIVFWFIVVATGATLGVHHHAVQTAQDAAQALFPIAGKYAGIVFGAGLLGSALLAVPVIAGTSGYVLAETFGWRRSLDASFNRARRFYASLIATTLVGLGMSFLPISAIGLLFAAGIAGGIATPLTLGLLMRVASDAAIMESHRIKRPLAIAGWAVTGIVVAATIAYFVSLASG